MRVLSSARELGLYTIALSTPDDHAHASYAHETIPLSSAASYTEIDSLVALCKSNLVDLVHPGYGFLSESPDFCDQLAASGVVFVGPGADILRRTGDKLSARRLAQDCGVPVLPALAEPVSTVDGLETFAHKVGFPIIIKAVDGGGGRGIRLVNEAATLRASFDRAVGESPSRKVFAEKAAMDGFRHVEVQILGDGRGNVCHFWDRECSIQRRFQKIVEIAPATLSSCEGLRARIIESAMHMAKSINYSSLGTWEFLVSPKTSEFYFMEVNPRLQVEHTITEAICGCDLVRFQLLLALSTRNPASVQRYPWLVLPGAHSAADPPPPCYAVQLRITAEDPQQSFAASIGRIRQVVWPGGNGLRVDTHLRAGSVVTSDFDSLLAKVIVTGADWDAVVEKAGRALQDTVVNGVTTNLGLLQNIVRATDFRRREFNTQWLESNLPRIINDNTDQTQFSRRHANPEAFKPSGQIPLQAPGQSSRSADDLVHKGDTFNIHLEGSSAPVNLPEMAVSVTGVIRNDFPHALTLKLSPLANGAGLPLGVGKEEEGYILRVSKQTGAQQQSTSKDGRQASNNVLLICPIAGQLVEVLVDEGDHVSEGDAVVIVRQMKMELEVRAHRPGTVSSLFTHDEGENVAVGTVVCHILPTNAHGRGKL